MHYVESYHFWLADPYFDENVKGGWKLSEMIKKRLKIVFTENWNLVPEDYEA